MNVLATQPGGNADRQTRFILLLGIFIWFLHFNIIYALASLSCTWDWFSLTVAGIPGLKFIEAAITLLTLVLMLPLIYLPWRNWRQFQTAKPKDNPRMLQETEQDRRPFLAFITMLLNSLFFLFVIAFLIPVFALNVCAQV